MDEEHRPTLRSVAVTLTTSVVGIAVVILIACAALLVVGYLALWLLYGLAHGY